jgi:non-specific serine/threonine protein kinase
LNTAGGHAGLYLGDLENATALHLEALGAWQELRNTRGIAWSLHNLGNISRERGDLDEADRRFTDSLRLYEELEDKPGVASILRNLGLVHCERGSLSEARRLYQESLAVARAAADAWNIVMSASGLGRLAVDSGDFALARAALREALATLALSQATWSLPYVLRAVAMLEVAQRQPVRAAQLLGTADAVRVTIGDRLNRADQLWHDRMLGTIRNAMREEAFASAWAHGVLMTPDEAVAYAQQSIQDVGSNAGAGSQSPGGPGDADSVSPLSRRETEVATLVSQGLTNRQIAGKLVVAEATAAKHIEHILDKLGLTSRAEIAVWATEHGMRGALAQP